MNLVKIADMLKNATDQSLAQEIQNPTGSVPSYMVLSELERRKKLRSSMMQPTDSKTVSEDLGAEFGGIAGLDQTQPDEYGVAQAQPQGYAGGGVVHARSGWFGEEVGDYGDTDPGYSPDVQPGGLFRTDQMIKPALTKEEQERWLAIRKARPDLSSAEQTQLARGIVPQTLQIKPDAAPSPAAAPTGGVPGAGRGNPPRSGIPGAAPASSVTNTTALSPEMQDLSEARKAGLEGLSQYNEYMKQAIAENKAAKAENAWQAVTMAGLGMLGGRSQFAAENIGQGALMGMQNYMGAEQSRQKEGRALAMDMAASGLKKSDILTNLAKAGFEGKKAEGYATQALAHAKYFNVGASQIGAKTTGASDKLDVQEIKALRSDYTKNSANPLFAKKYPTFNDYIAAMGYSGSRGPSGTMGGSNDPLGLR